MNPLSIIIVALFLSFCSLAEAKEHFEIVLMPEWTLLSNNKNNASLSGERWVLVGTITFKKKSKEPLALSKLVLNWNGSFLDTMTASLYQKPVFIEENIISDGIWNKARQVIIFNFDKITLHPTTTFYLVLTIPTTKIDLFKNSCLSCCPECLPQQFKEAAQSLSLPLLVEAE
jgi:hypothetical protein